MAKSTNRGNKLPTLSAFVLLSPLSFRISESNDALACFDASIDANLEGKLSLPFITVIALYGTETRSRP
jgi:hypothetical protein